MLLSVSITITLDAKLLPVLIVKYWNATFKKKAVQRRIFAVLLIVQSLCKKGY